MKNCWFFPESSAGEFDGFNDAGIEFFAGSPYSYIAREVIQNSLDAAKSLGEPASVPVKVAFDLVEINKSDFPDIKGLRKAIAGALKQAGHLNEEASIAFLKQSQKILSHSSIPCLRIADSNTVGLLGPCELPHPFFVFVKARGQSIKPSDTAGGSFGIGKHAPFALSDLRTIFVSTGYENNGKRVDYAQGKSILMSHDQGKGKRARGTGYFGKPSVCMPITPRSEIPKWMRRDFQFSGKDWQGTTLFVAGFRKHKQWPNLLLASVISNYFSAIYDSKLEVSIDGGALVVNSTNLLKWFENSAVRNAARTEDLEGGFDRARDMVRCLSNSKAKEETSQMKYLGECRLRLLVKEGYKKRVGILRNGMLVTSDLRGLKQFPGFSDFIAVVDCMDPTGNTLLRKMENPEHNDFEPDRLRDPKEIQKSRDELERLAKFVRKSLKKHAQAESDEATELAELSDFFSDPDEEISVSDAKSGETDLGGKFIIVPRQPKKKSATGIVEDDPGDDSGGSGDGSGGKGDGPGGGPGKGSGGGNGTGTKAAKPIALGDIRCVVNSLTSRDIYFTPLKSGVANLSIQDVGADAVYPLYIAKVEGGGQAVNGKIEQVSVKAGERMKLKIELKGKFSGALRVVANEV